MSIIVCGPGKGTEKKYSCICCGWETDDIEQMAVSMCWDCVYGKEGCPNCEAMRAEDGSISVVDREESSSLVNVESFVKGVQEGTVGK